MTTETKPPQTPSPIKPTRKKKRKSFKSLMRQLVKTPPRRSSQFDETEPTAEELARRGLGSGKFSKLDTI